MNDKLQEAINALRAAGDESGAKAVEELRAELSRTMDQYHAGQRASYESGRKDEAESRSRAARDVLDERQRQITVEGWDEGHDDHHYNGELAAAAACYASPYRAFKAVTSVGRGYESLTTYRDLWPWRDEWWRPKDRRADLVRAGALIVAEIERMDRAAATGTPTTDVAPCAGAYAGCAPECGPHNRCTPT